MQIPRIPGVLLCLLLAAGLGALRAEEPDAFFKEELERPTTWGVQGCLTRPMLDLASMDRHGGQGGGLFVEERLGPATVLQTRADYVNYSQASGIPTPNAFQLTPPNVTALAANAASLGMDLRLYLPYPGLQSAYLLGGMSAIRYEFKTVSTVSALDPNGVPLPAAPFELKSKTSMKWGVDVGLGYELGHGCAVTVRYNYVPINGMALAALEYGLRVSF